MRFTIQYMLLLAVLTAVLVPMTAAQGRTRCRTPGQGQQNSGAGAYPGASDTTASTGASSSSPASSAPASGTSGSAAPSGTTGSSSSGASGVSGSSSDAPTSTTAASSSAVNSPEPSGAPSAMSQTSTDSASSSSSGSKRGLAAPWDSVGSDLDSVTKGKISWMYNWESYAPPGGKQFEFVPMLRTGQQGDLDRMKQNLPSSGAKHFMCLNEPDIAAQANLSVDEGVKIWINTCWPQKQALGFKMGAPAISNGPAGLKWLQDFLAQVKATHPPDFANVHWYGNSIDDFTGHVKSVHDAVNLPIWVTEFASQQTSAADQKTFMTAALTFLDGASYVDRYSWFAYSRTSAINDASRLLSSSGAKTDLMTTYSS